jgi:hypothetical protein
MSTAEQQFAHLRIAVDRLADRIRVNAEGALRGRADHAHVARSLEAIAEDAVTLLVEAQRIAGVGADAPTGDERVRQLASNRCQRQAWPESGQEWTFTNDGLRKFAEAVAADANWRTDGVGGRDAG